MTSPDRVGREHLLRNAVLNGDVTAWQVWYEESYDDVRAYILWCCGGRTDVADEVVQETWLTAVRQIRRFDPAEGAFAAWVRGIAVNCLRTCLRKARLQRAVSIRMASDLSGAEDTTHPLERQEQSEWIAAALVDLPCHYEAVLKAKYFDRWSVVEIAAAWNETPKAIESLLTRAREAFRRSYQQSRRKEA